MRSCGPLNLPTVQWVTIVPKKQGSRQKHLQKELLPLALNLGRREYKNRGICNHSCFTKQFITLNEKASGNKVSGSVASSGKFRKECRRFSKGNLT
jgi:hypothetical protein